MTTLFTGLLIRAAIALLMVVAWLDRTLQPRRVFPRDPDALRRDPRWALAKLRAAGALADGDEVERVSVEVVKQNEAFRSQVAKVDVHLRGDGGGDGAARVLRLFAKFAPRPDSLREHAVYILQRNHSKEVAIYRDLVASPAYGDAVAAVRCYAAEEHALSGGFCLLLERFEPVREVAEADGCPEDLAARAMDAFAALHARTWGDEVVAAAVLERTPPAVIDWLAGQLPGADAPIFAAMLRAAWHHDAERPSAVLHSDARVGNMLFSPEGEASERFAFIDWQAARRGKAAFDVAYFLVLSVEPAVRRTAGDALLARYYEGLCAGGVRGYSPETFCADIRFGILLTLGFVTLPLMSAEASTTQDNRTGIDALGKAWARRMVAVVEELDLGWVAGQAGVDAAALRAAFARSNDGAVADFPVAAADRGAAAQARAEFGAGVIGATPPAARATARARMAAAAAAVLAVFTLLGGCGVDVPDDKGADAAEVDAADGAAAADGGPGADTAAADAGADVAGVDAADGAADVAPECVADADCAAKDDGNRCNGVWVCSAGVCAFDKQKVVCDGKDDTACLVAQCVPATGACAALPVVGYKGCSDGDVCTQDDACEAGVCKPGKKVCECSNDADCAAFDDGNACNGGLYCAKGSYPFVCKPDFGTVVLCDSDKDTACRVNGCNPKTGECVMTNVVDGKACDDGDACTVGDGCLIGACVGGQSVCACKVAADCAGQDDGDPCNGQLVCEQNQCVVDPATVVVCDKSADSACVVAQCSAKTGACAPTPTPAGTACDDGNACNVLESCDGKGVCAGGNPICECQTDADCASSDDGNACNGVVICNQGSHTCGIDAASVVVCDASKNTICTKEACAPKTGACGPTPVVDGVSCQDGDACTVGDGCKGGVCKGGVDTCQCKQDSDCLGLEDGDVCNGTLICAQNVCVVDKATIVSCDTSADGACASTVCAAKTGVCEKVGANDGKACDDGDACTEGDACGAGSCVAGKDVCNTGPSWAEVYAAAFKAPGCGGCHSEYGSMNSAYATLKDGSYCGGPLLVPGDAAASTIVAKLVAGVALKPSCGAKMPKGSSGIDKAAGEALNAWINAGAKP